MDLYIEKNNLIVKEKRFFGRKFSFLLEELFFTYEWERLKQKKNPVMISILYNYGILICLSAQK